MFLHWFATYRAFYIVGVCLLIEYLMNKYQRQNKETIKRVFYSQRRRRRRH